jgi:hypothetical protein
MLNYLYEDIETGERFFIQAFDDIDRDNIMLENDIVPEEVELIGIYTDEEAEEMGYDTF